LISHHLIFTDLDMSNINCRDVNSRKDKSLFRLKQPMRAPDSPWASFLLPIVKGWTHDIRDWRELRKQFGLTAAQYIVAAHDFFCDGIQGHHPFSLDCQWIWAINKLVSYLNHDVQQWRSQDAQSFSIVFTFTKLVKLLPNCLGFSEAQRIDFVEIIDVVQTTDSISPSCAAPMARFCLSTTLCQIFLSSTDMTQRNMMKSLAFPRLWPLQCSLD
jgi:hypothetical protein